MHSVQISRSLGTNLRTVSPPARETRLEFVEYFFRSDESACRPESMEPRGFTNAGNGEPPEQQPRSFGYAFMSLSLISRTANRVICSHSGPQVIEADLAEFCKNGSAKLVPPLAASNGKLSAG